MKTYLFILALFGFIFTPILYAQTNAVNETSKAVITEEEKEHVRFLIRKYEHNVRLQLFTAADATKIEAYLRSLVGVLDCKIDVLDKLVRVTAEPNMLNYDEIFHDLTRMGYKIVAVHANKVVFSKTRDAYTNVKINSPQPDGSNTATTAPQIDPNCEDCAKVKVSEAVKNKYSDPAKYGGSAINFGFPPKNAETNNSLNEGDDNDGHEANPYSKAQQLEMLKNKKIKADSLKIINPK